MTSPTDESQDPLGIACLSAFQIIKRLDQIMRDMNDSRLGWDETVENIRKSIAEARVHAMDILQAV